MAKKKVKKRAKRKPAKKRVKKKPAAALEVREPKPNGRPRWEPSELQIDQARKLARMDCTLHQIAAFFGVSDATVDRRVADTPAFAEAVRNGREHAEVVFRQMLWKHAGNGIGWAGKLLGTKFGYWSQPQVAVIPGNDSGGVVIMLPHNDRDDANEDGTLAISESIDTTATEVG